MRKHISILVGPAIALVAIGFSAWLMVPTSSQAEASSARVAVMKHQTLIADCMRKRGHRYVPSVPRDLLQEEALQDAIATGRDPGQALTQALKSAAPDPNVEYQNALEKSARSKYRAVLWGTDTQSGCVDSTYAAAWGMTEDAVIAKGLAQRDEAESRPEVRRAADIYVSCMKEAGYNVEDVDDIYRFVGVQAESLSEDKARALAQEVYASHDACAAPYQEIFNGAHLKIMHG